MGQYDHALTLRTSFRRIAHGVHPWLPLVYFNALSGHGYIYIYIYYVCEICIQIKYVYTLILDTHHIIYIHILHIVTSPQEVFNLISNRLPGYSHLRNSGPTCQSLCPACNPWGSCPRDGCPAAYPLPEWPGVGHTSAAEKQDMDTFMFVFP